MKIRFLYTLLFLLLFVETTIRATHQYQKPWQWCVTHISQFYVPSSSSSENVNNNSDDPLSTMEWTKEGYELCGFQSLSMITMKKLAFFPPVTNDNDNNNNIIRHTFIGDSTSLRAYGTAVNEFFGKPLKIGKVAQSPPFLSSSISENENDQNEENNKESQSKAVRTIDKHGIDLRPPLSSSSSEDV